MVRFTDLTNNTTVFFSKEASKEVAAIDAKLCTNDPLYSDRNAEIYYVCLNTWLNMFRDRVPSIKMQYMLHSIATQGLIATINDCSTVADEIIHQSNGEMHIDYDRTPYYLYSTMLQLAELPLAEVLQLLRFPKRLSPLVDKDAEFTPRNDSITSFFNMNRSHMVHSRDALWDQHTNYIFSQMRKYACDMLKGVEPNMLLRSFPPGAAFDSAKVLGSKINLYASTHWNWYDNPLYPTGIKNSRIHEYQPYKFYKDKFVSVSDVPKNYKAVRLVAPEMVNNQYELSALRIPLYEALAINGYGDMIILDDPDNGVNSQFESQTRCDLSLYSDDISNYATIDLTQASDSIPYVGAVSVFPNDVISYINQFRANKLLYEGKVNGVPKRCNNHIFLTAGNRLTPVCQGIYFLCAILVAYDWYSIFVNPEDDIPLKRPLVYNDDLMVDNRAASIVIDVLTEIGCKVNLSKTFYGDSMYRESCGAEYLNGYRVDTFYFPRKPLFAMRKKPYKVQKQELGAVIDLQHKLFSYYNASTFLCNYVRTYMPNMTSHVPYSICDDLWEVVPFYQIGYDHSYGDDSKHEVELHYVLRNSGLTLAEIKELGYTGNDTDDDPVLDMYSYVQFLIHGPEFDDPVLRLLGISSRGRRPWEFYASARQQWQLRADT